MWDYVANSECNGIAVLSMAQFMYAYTYTYVSHRGDNTLLDKSFILKISKKGLFYELYNCIFLFIVKRKLLGYAYKKHEKLNTILVAPILSLKNIA